jgi:hypothetical protein
MEEKLTSRFLEAIFAAERKFDRDLAKVGAARATAMAPYLAIADAFEAAQTKSITEHNAAVERLNEPVQAAQRALTATHTNGQDPVAAKQLLVEEQRKFWDTVKNELGPKQKAFMEPFERALEPYREAYGAASQAFHKARLHALAIADIRFTQICGHLNVDREAREKLAQLNG